MDANSGSSWFGPLAPMLPLAPPDVKGRILDYQSGYNLNTQPKTSEGVTFQMLRNFADSYDILRLLIETRKDQMARLDWNVAPRNKELRKKGAKVPEDVAARVEAIKEFFLRPDRKNFWGDWLRMLLEDLFVIDAPTIYRRRTFGGDLYALQPIDGGTIKRVIDDFGNTPEEGTAYQQILKGYPAVDYTNDELIYRPRVQRTHKVYGYSPVEQIVMTINIGMRRQVWQLESFTEGNMPEALLGTPDGWTPDQIKTFQEWFDMMLQGNTGERRRAKFVPGAIAKGYVSTKPAEIIDPKVEEWLVRVMCFCFNISPQPFVQMMNRATSETAQETAALDGLAPIQGWVKGTMDTILIDDFDSADLEFIWENEDELDPDAKSQIVDREHAAGRLTYNEARREQGLDPDPHPNADRAMFKTAAGWVPIFLTPEEEAEKKAAAEAMANAASGKPGEEGEDGDGPPAPGGGSKPPVTPSAGTEVAEKSDRPFHGHSAASTGHLCKASAPTEAQIKAGNYKKDHVRVKGLSIAIENPAGSTRSGKDKGGKEWSVEMPFAYGYIKRTTGADGDHVDVFVGDDDDSDLVFIIDQHDLDSGEFDEHKVMLGFASYDEALEAYCGAFSDGQGEDRAAHVVTTSVKKFKEWLKDGDTTLSAFRKMAGTAGFEKADVTPAPYADPLRPSAAKIEKKLKAKLVVMLSKLGRSVAAQVKAKLSEVAKVEYPEDYDLEELLNSLDLDIITTTQSELEEAMSRVGKDASKISLSQIGQAALDDSIVEVVNERAHNWAKERAAELVGLSDDPEYSLDRTTREMLRTTISDGIAGNKSMDDIATEIKDTYAFSEERAQTIAAAEITSANSMGALASYEEAAEMGIKIKKSWLVLEDGCDICQENADAGSIDLDEEFPSGDMAPGAHPHCRCVLVPEVEDDEAEAPEETED